MRLLFSFLVSLFFTSHCIAQDSIRFEFNKRYDIGSNKPDLGSKTMFWNDGILTMGLIFEADYTSSLSLTFLDTTGNEIWSKNLKIPQALVVQGNDIIAFDNNSFYMVGVVYIDQNNGYDAFFAKFNSDGDTIFFKQYPDPEYSWPLQFQNTGSKELIVLSGKKVNSDDQLSKYIIWKYDTTGARSVIYEANYEMHYARKIFKYENYIYVGGVRRTTSSGNFNVKAFIDVFHSNFAVSYRWNPTVTLNEEFLELFNWNGQLYLARKTSEKMANGAYYDFGRLSIARVHNNYVSEENIFGPNPKGSFSWGNVGVINDSIMVINCSKGKNTFYFINKNLEDFYTIRYGHSTNAIEHTYNIAISPNGNILGTGFIVQDSSHTQDHVVFLTEPVSNFFSRIVGLNELQNPTTIKLKVYPTLFISEITIEGYSESDIYQVLITNIQGKVVREETTRGLGIINTFELPPGIYVITILNGSNKQSFKIFKPTF